MLRFHVELTPRKVGKIKVTCSRCGGPLTGKGPRGYCKVCRAAYMRENRKKMKVQRHNEAFNEGVEAVYKLVQRNPEFSFKVGLILQRELKKIKK